MAEQSKSSRENKQSTRSSVVVVESFQNFWDKQQHTYARQKEPTDPGKSLVGLSNVFFTPTQGP